MNYEEAFSLTGWDLLGTFWWVGLLVAGGLLGIFSKWIAPK